MQSFGPCVHIVTLAVDLATSSELRSVVLLRRVSREAAEEARGRRRALAVEQRFDHALRAWISPSAGTIDVEMAASPFHEGTEPPLWRGYGDKTEAGPTRAIAIFARKRGERNEATSHLKEALGSCLAQRATRVQSAAGR